MSTRRDRAARAVAAGIWPAIKLDDAERGEAYRIADMVLAEIDRVPDISELIEASSLGTPGAKALRASVSDEQAQRAIAVAHRIREHGMPGQARRIIAEALSVVAEQRTGEASPLDFDGARAVLNSLGRGGFAVTQTDDGAVRSPATPGAVPHPAAQAGAAGWRPAPSSPLIRQPRVFELYRHRDVTGKSGTGTVAWGTQWLDGTVSVRWAGATPSFSNWDSLDVLVAVHGHEGATEVRWLDGAE